MLLFTVIGLDRNRCRRGRSHRSRLLYPRRRPPGDRIVQRRDYPVSRRRHRRRVRHALVNLLVDLSYLGLTQGAVRMSPSPQHLNAAGIPR